MMSEYEIDWSRNKAGSVQSGQYHLRVLDLEVFKRLEAIFNVEHDKYLFTGLVPDFVETFFPQVSDGSKFIEASEKLSWRDIWIEIGDHPMREVLKDFIYEYEDDSVTFDPLASCVGRDCSMCRHRLLHAEDTQRLPAELRAQFRRPPSYTPSCSDDSSSDDSDDSESI